MKSESTNTHKCAFNSFPSTAQQVHGYNEKYREKLDVKGHYLFRFFMWGMIKIASSMSWNAAYNFGTGLGKFGYWCGIRRKVVMKNLDIAYGESKTPGEKKEIYKNCLINMGRYTVNFFRINLLDQAFWENHCSWKNQETLKELYNRKKGVLFPCSHFGTWDLTGAKVGFSGYPIAVIGKRIKNPPLNKYALETRDWMNLATIKNKGTMEQIIEELKDGGGVAMALDQDMKPHRGIFLKWLGHTACSVRSAAFAVKQSGASVVPIKMVQKGPKDFEFEVGDEITWEPFPGDPEKELAINAQKQSDAVQKWILEDPKQWFWLHKRYKTQPEGTPNPYD